MTPDARQGSGCQRFYRFPQERLGAVVDTLSPPCRSDIRGQNVYDTMPVKAPVVGGCIKTNT